MSLARRQVCPDELAEAVAATRADVIGLQEVDRDQPRSGSADQTADAAAALGSAHWRFAAALCGTPGTAKPWTAVRPGEDPVGPAYGVGLVSRYPVRRWLVRRFPAAPVTLPLLVPGGRGIIRVRDEPRVALGAVIDGPAGPLTVFTAHLSFVPGWNLAQLVSLAGWARALPGPKLLVGDFNLPGALPRLASRWHQLTRLATYPSYGPRLQFDHILADGIPASAVTHAEALRLPVSDHCALVADLDL
jgi:endonuclease/exonuclease/phosphatase family metal-dependent hydrolase